MLNFKIDVDIRVWCLKVSHLNMLLSKKEKLEWNPHKIDKDN